MKKEITGKYIENNERKIVYYITGNTNAKYCMFFLNGLYHGPDAWIKQQRYKYFKENYKMIFMDYRGVGCSINKKKTILNFDLLACDIKSIIAKEDVGKTILLGYSFGGILALWFAYKFPEYTKTLILINTALEINFHTRKMLDQLVESVNEGMALKNIFLFIYPWHHSLEYLEKIIDMDVSIREKFAIYNKNIWSFLQLIKAIRNKPDIMQVLKNITTPVYCIGSDGDLIFPLIFQKEMFSHICNCSYHILPECGHASYIEKYRKVNKLIQIYLQQNHFI